METSAPPVLRLRGEIDIQATRDLAEPLSVLVGGVDPAVVIDLSGVTFMDSTGLGAVVRTHQRLRRQSRSLVLICPQGAVLRLLEVSGLLGELVVAPDEPAALALAREGEA